MANASLTPSIANSSSVSEPPIGVATWVMVCIGLLMAFTILANFLVICAFFQNSRVRTIFNYYIVNLAVSDLMTGCIGMVFSAIQTHYGRWPLSYKACTVYIYLDYLTTSVALVTLMTISLDRVWAVNWPMSYRENHTVKKCVVLMILSWVFSHACLLPGIVYSRLYLGNPEAECLWDAYTTPGWAGSYYPTLVVQWAPIIITVISYPYTAWKIWQRTQRAVAEVKPPGRISQTALKDRQAFFLLTLLFAALTVMWGPWLVFQTMNFYWDFFEEQFFMVTWWLVYAISAVNPVLFTVGSPELRYEIKKVTGLYERLQHSHDKHSSSHGPSVRAGQRATFGLTGLPRISHSEPNPALGGA